MVAMVVVVLDGVMALVKGPDTCMCLHTYGRRRCTTIYTWHWAGTPLCWPPVFGTAMRKTQFQFRSSRIPLRSTCWNRNTA